MASLYITEASNLARDYNGQSILAIQFPALAVQLLPIGGS